MHKVVMHMLHIDLKQEILMHPMLIDQPDADDGRTPLHWAAAVTVKQSEHCSSMEPPQISQTSYCKARCDLP